MHFKKKELIKENEFLIEKISTLNKKLVASDEAIYKYKKLFSQLFDRLQITGVSRYKVEKDFNDGKVLFNIVYEDGTGYVYKVELVSTSYEEDLNGNIQVDETRQN